MMIKNYCAMVLVIFFCAGCFADSGATTQGSSSSPDAKAALQIDEQGYVKIGGLQQWVTIKGRSLSNPVVLFVHGGPGNPLSLYSDSLYKGWEERFTIVHWDQRGSGKTYEANEEPGEVTLESVQKTELSIELIVKDGVELTDYVLKKLGRDKLILTGTSWGSVIAVKMAQTKPENYLFYVGVSQFVSYNEGLQKSYKKVLKIAQQREDKAALEKLKTVGEPPWQSPRSFGVLRRIIRKYESEPANEQPELDIAEAYNTDASREAYFSGEEFSFIKFVGLKGDGMAQSIELMSCCTVFQIPVYFIQGEQDLLTLPEMTRNYFDEIKAPKKEYFELEHSGHDPNKRMLDKQAELMSGVYQHFSK